MATNWRKRYFYIGENTSREQIYALLDDVESADEDGIDNLTNDSDTELIAEEEVAHSLVHRTLARLHQRLIFKEKNKKRIM